MTGRVSKYTPDRTKRIIDAVRVGATYRLAAAYAGITDDTLTNWLHRYSEFSDAIKEAEGAAAVGWLAKIEKAATELTWQAAAWKLERRYPQEYGRTVQEVQGKDGGPIEVADVTDARGRIASSLDELAARRRTRGVAEQAI